LASLKTKKVKIKAYKAATAEASVTVNIRPKIPPKMITGKNNIGSALLNFNYFSGQLVIG
jgi:hypothetical protein